MKHIQQRRFAIGRIPQDDYLTPNDEADLIEFICKDKNLANYTVATQDNMDHSTGVEQATEQWLMSHDVARQVEFDVSSEQLGRILLLVFGAVVTTQPDEIAAPTVYQHVFSMMNAETSRQLPATSLLEVVGSAINRLFPSMVAESFGLSGDAINRISGTCALRGSGKYVSPSGLAFPDPLGLLHYFYNSQVGLTVDDAGVITNYGNQKRINSWEFGATNELLAEDGYRPGAALFQTADPASGALRSECLFGKRGFTMGYNVRLNSESEELAALRSQKLLKPQVDLIGPKIGATAFNHKLTILGEKSPYEAVETGERNGIVTLNLKPKMLYDRDLDKIVTATLINEVESYTT
jgi:hypothetical protein